jgi:hypothetical protein
MNSSFVVWILYDSFTSECAVYVILHNEEIYNLYSSPNTVRMIKSRRMRWIGHVACMGTVNYQCVDCGLLSCDAVWLIGCYQCFHFHGICSSNMSITTYSATWHCNTEDHSLHFHHSEKLKSLTTIDVLNIFWNFHWNFLYIVIETAVYWH